MFTPLLNATPRTAVGVRFHDQLGGACGSQADHCFDQDGLPTTVTVDEIAMVRCRTTEIRSTATYNPTSLSR
jgi:hypothetical protein